MALFEGYGHTHFKRLKEPEEPLEFLLAATDKLGPRLGAILFQLPPNMRCDLERMQTFLGHLPRGTPVSFEFRHESWFNEETYQLLRDRNIALCHADSEENALPFVSTADWGYLRLRQPSYSPADLAAWLERIADAGWRDSYVFFKHEDEAAGPAMAKDFMAMVDA